VPPSAKTGSSWAAAAAERLTAAGYRRGGARRAVIDLLDKQECALSAIEIEQRLHRSRNHASRASIYRVLEQLEELGLVTRLDLGVGTARFETVRSERHHHHLLCDDCGDLVPFADDDLEQAIDGVARRLPYQVSGHDVTLHGSCASCSA
jgi:Fur family transcriptional regulator, ferric uptake regulator